jgi:hypothetical protein
MGRDCKAESGLTLPLAARKLGYMSDHEPTIADLAADMKRNQAIIRNAQDRAFDPRPTGMDMVQASGIRCVLGPRNRYYWLSGYVMLTRDVATGRDAESIFVVRHELAHTQQPKWLLFLAMLFPPARWYSEMDAWERVFRL